MWIYTTGAGIVQTKIANSSKRGTSRAIFKWTRRVAVPKVTGVKVRLVRSGGQVGYWNWRCVVGQGYEEK